MIADFPKPKASKTDDNIDKISKNESSNEKRQNH